MRIIYLILLSGSLFFSAQAQLHTTYRLNAKKQLTIERRNTSGDTIRTRRSGIRAWREGDLLRVKIAPAESTPPEVYGFLESRNPNDLSYLSVLPPGESITDSCLLRYEVENWDWNSDSIKAVEIESAMYYYSIPSGQRGLYRQVDTLALGKVGKKTAFLPTEARLSLEYRLNPATGHFSVRFRNDMKEMLTIYSRDDDTDIFVCLLDHTGNTVYKRTFTLQMEKRPSGQVILLRPRESKTYDFQLADSLAKRNNGTSWPEIGRVALDFCVLFYTTHSYLRGQFLVKDMIPVYLAKGVYRKEVELRKSPQKRGYVK